MLAKGVCQWYDFKCGAVSIVGASTRPMAGDDVLVFDADGKDLPAAANLLADRAHEEGKWLVEVYPDKLLQQPNEGMKAHFDYLKKLDCVLWNESYEKVSDYVRMRQSCKVVADDDGKGEIKVEVPGIPEDNKGTAPVTLLVKLQPAAWMARVYEDGRETPSRYVVMDEPDTRLIVFNCVPGKSSIRVKYKIGGKAR
jgi:hypothetical protein